MKKAYLIYLWDSNTNRVITTIKIYSDFEKAKKERAQREEQLFYTHPNWCCLIDELPFED